MEQYQLSYKGYQTSILFSAEDSIFYGKLEGIDDFVDFMGETLPKAEAAFREAVEDYLSFCEETGKIPCLPSS